MEFASRSGCVDSRNLKTRNFTRCPVLDRDTSRFVGTWGSRALSRAGRPPGTLLNLLLCVLITVGRWEMLFLLQCHSEFRCELHI